MQELIVFLHEARLRKAFRLLSVAVIPFSFGATQPARGKMAAEILAKTGILNCQGIRITHGNQEQTISHTQYTFALFARGFGLLFCKK